MGLLTALPGSGDTLSKTSVMCTYTAAPLAFAPVTNTSTTHCVDTTVGAGDKVKEARTPSLGTDRTWKLRASTPVTGALYVAVTRKGPCTESPESNPVVDSVGIGPPTGISSCAGWDCALIGLMLPDVALMPTKTLPASNGSASTMSSRHLWNDMHAST